MKKVFRLNVDCGRMGTLTGVFISTQEEVDMLISSKLEVYFGEVLGKHSEIFGAISSNEISVVSDNQEVVKVVEENELTNGYNPFEYSAVHTDSEYEGMYVGEIIQKMLKIK